MTTNGRTPKGSHTVAVTLTPAEIRDLECRLKRNPNTFLERIYSGLPADA